jgi:pyridinium-3,5-bisthiocarboxylic acid mononucleotide nickel chelatase
MSAMRIAYLDCFSGISGDMFLGALIDAGVPRSLFGQTMAALDLGASLEISRVTRSGISATKVEVRVKGEKDQPRSAAAGAALKPVHSSHLGSHSHHHGRAFQEIRQILARAGLRESVKRTAIAIFEKLGAAEAKIHNVAIEQVHFHEVGAVDTLVDITCAAAGAEALGADEFLCSPLNVGGGTVTCAHGIFPVPAPATVELLKGGPVYSSGIEAELVTPTGAAIVATLCQRFATFPQMTIVQTGYGAGSRDFPGQANVLRITVGESLAIQGANKSVRPAPAEETIVVVEANLDDVNPQVMGYVLGRLLEAGALDAFTTPVQMKKNRPGVQLTVLAKPEDADPLARIIFAETTTLGLRSREERRQVLSRRWEPVKTRFGEVRMKLGSLNGAITSYAPEYEDCRRIAREQRVALKLVMQEAVQEFLKSKTK